ncbi:hypothetical protein SSTU70S_05346 [Stutzerimonas stutzeri]
MPPVSANGIPVKTNKPFFDIVEHHEKQNEDQEQRHGDDNLQPLRCRFKLLKGTAPVDPITCRDIYLGLDFLFCLRY